MNRRSNIASITEGVIWKQLLSFFFPIMLGTFFQMLYNTVDAVIVGRFLGKQALAAVGGGTSTATNLLIGFFTGLSTGATVIISQYFGAHDEQKVSRAIHNAFAIGLAGGILISAVGFCASSLLLKLIGTPEDVLPFAVRYMKIYFAGAVITILYNMGAGIYRALGDSKRPLYFLVVGCFTNILLDLVFVRGFSMGIDGAAYATVASQLVSLVLVFRGLLKRDDCLKLSFAKIRFDSLITAKTLKIGLPNGMQSVLYSISNLMIVSHINAFGTDCAAAWAAYGKLDHLFWMIINAFGISITTFVGQNFGARKIERAKKGTKTGLVICFTASFILEALYLLLARYGLKLFSTDEAVIQTGLRLVHVIVPFYFAYAPVEILSGAIRGTGKTLVSTMLTVFGICGFRALWLSVVDLFWPTLEGAVACYPITWSLTSILFIIYYLAADVYDEKKLRLS